MAEKKVEIARALVQLAWADNQLTPEESDLLNTFLRELGFPPDEASQAWLTEDQPPDYAALHRLLPDQAERRELVRKILALSLSDDAISFEELDLVERAARALEISDDELAELRREVTSTP
jgi:uncharacterized tellurite resistance protein B-like protein